MKITRRKITASSEIIKIPEPFDKYYEIISDEEFEQETGAPAIPYLVNEIDGYEIDHIAYVKAKPEYEDALANDGIDYAELVREGNKEFIAYVVGDRIYSIDESDIDRWIDFQDYEDEVEDFYGDDMIAGIAAKLSVPRDIAEVIYSWYEEEGAMEDFDSVRDFLDYVEDDIWDMIDACDDDTIKEMISNAISASTKIEASYKPGDRVRIHFGIYDGSEGVIDNLVSNDTVDGAKPDESYYAVILDGQDDYTIFEEKDIDPIEACDITGAIDTGLEYWYYGRHGLGPGTIPQGVTVLDTVEEGWKTWMLLDKLLTTEELKYYDLKEEWPPEGSISHNGVVIEGAIDTSYEESTNIECSYHPGDRVSIHFGIYDGKEGTIVDTISPDKVVDAKPGETYYSVRIDGEGYNYDYVLFEQNDMSPLVEACDYVEGATVEELEEAMNRYKGDVDRISKQLDDLQKDTIKKSGLFDKKRKHRLFSSEVELVDETDDSLEYVVSSNEDDDFDWLDEEQEVVESMSMIRYNNHKILPNTFCQCWEVLDNNNELVKTGFKSEREARDYIDKIEASLDVEPSEEKSIQAADEVEVMAGLFDYNRDNEIMTDRLRDRWLEPPEYDITYPEDIDDLVLEFPLDNEVIINEDGDWTFTDEASIADELDPEEEYVTPDDVIEDLMALLTWHLPDTEGTYHVKANVKLVYNRFEDKTSKLVIDESSITDVNLERNSNIESSTVIEAAMTEEELDRAIMDGKPFDMNDFRRYKSPVGEEILYGGQLDIGDSVEITETAEEVDLGTIVKILDINNPGEDWIDYTYRCELITPIENSDLRPGDEIILHFDEDEPIGVLTV